jgi:Rieske Fe-S protein
MKTLVLFVLFTVVFYSCRRQNDNYVPNVSVNVTIYPSNPQYFRLNTVGGWDYVDGGVRGIIVYRKSLNEFVALDRNCSVNPLENCSTVSVDSSNNIYAVCPCCSSQFVLTDGSVAKSPAIQPLRAYQTYWDGNALRIVN